MNQPFHPAKHTNQKASEYRPPKNFTYSEKEKGKTGISKVRPVKRVARSLKSKKALKPVI